MFLFCVQAWWWGSVQPLIKQLLTQTKSCTSTEPCIVRPAYSKSITNNCLWNHNLELRRWKRNPSALLRGIAVWNFNQIKCDLLWFPIIFIPILRQRIQAHGSRDMVRGPLNGNVSPSMTWELYGRESPSPVGSVESRPCLSWLPYSTYLYLDFHLLCSMTKLKEYSREIC